eukprot:SAG31_NODE_2337_length_5921_cov_4.269323_3_plen_116_part_00
MVAFTFLPLLPIRPQKFALMFSMGSLLTLAAMAMYKGPSEFISRCVGSISAAKCGLCCSHGGRRLMISSAVPLCPWIRSRLAPDQMPVSAFYSVMLIGTVRLPYMDTHSFQLTVY